MLKDITLGQYFPSKSVVHNMDPRSKIVLTILYVAMIFTAKNAFSMAVSIILLFVIIAFSKIPLRLVFKSIKSVVPIIVITGFLNIFYVQGETVLFEYGFFCLTLEGIYNMLFIIVRILIMIVGTSLLTFTTTPTTLTDGIERLISPLKLFKINVHDLAMMMTLALRFVPTLIEETDRIISAQKARGADMESGGLIKRLKALIPVLLPLLISAVTRAWDLAVAMECRCYTGVGRTRMRVLKFSLSDYIAFAVFAVLFAAVILLNIKFGSILVSF